jgi:O-antigen/teichoic acid export membrane protein
MALPDTAPAPGATRPGTGAAGHGPAHPPSVARGVAVSAVAQLGAKALHLVLNVVSTLAIVRYLAPGEYGVYVVVLTVTTLAALAADFGLPKLAVREICAAPDDPDAENRVLGTIVVLRLVLASASVGVVMLALFALQQPSHAYAAAAVASLTGVGEAVASAVVVVFQLRLAQHYEAWVRTGAELLETAAILVLVSAHASLVWLFVPPAAGTALAAAALVLLAHRRFGIRPRFDGRRARVLLIAALPIAPALLVGVLYRKMDSLALAALRPSEDVGIYGAAVQPIEYALLSTALLMNVVFPLMSAAHGRGDLAKFAVLYRRGTEALVLLTVALPVVLLFVARPLALHVFGPSYVSADVPLVLLATAMVPLVIAVWQSLALLLGGHQKVTLYYNVAALAVSAVLSTVLVRAFGLVGAGVAAVGTGLFVMTASGLAVRRLMGVRLEIAPLLRIAAAAVGATGVLAVLSLAGMTWWVLALVGLLVFVVLARVTGAHRSLLGVVS